MGSMSTDTGDGMQESDAARFSTGRYIPTGCRGLLRNMSNNNNRLFAKKNCESMNPAVFAKK
jgi:hypothetical protein